MCHLVSTHWSLGDFKEMRKVIFPLILVIDGWSKIIVKWMPMDLTDSKSTLVKLMAWCRQAQAITWANVDRDLCRHMASLGQNGCREIPLLVKWDAKSYTQSSIAWETWGKHDAIYSHHCASRVWPTLHCDVTTWTCFLRHETSWHPCDCNVLWHLVNHLTCWEAEMKYPIFCRRHFQMHFREWKCIIFD